MSIGIISTQEYLRPSGDLGYRSDVLLVISVYEAIEF